MPENDTPSIALHNCDDTVVERDNAQRRLTRTPSAVGVRPGGPPPQRSRWRGSKGNKQRTAHTRDRGLKVEGELQEVRNDILAVMDQNLIPSESTGASQVFDFKVKGDYYGYLAEFATGDAGSKAAQGARVGCAEDTKITDKRFGRDASYLFEHDTEFLCLSIRGPSESTRGVQDGTCYLRGCDRGSRQ